MYVYVCVSLDAGEPKSKRIDSTLGNWRDGSLGVDGSVGRFFLNKSRVQDWWFQSFV